MLRKHWMTVHLLHFSAMFTIQCALGQKANLPHALPREIKNVDASEEMKYYTS